MSEQTFHVTREELAKAEAQEAKYHDGKTPKDSDVSAMKVCLMSTYLPSRLPYATLSTAQTNTPLTHWSHSNS